MLLRCFALEYVVEDTQPGWFSNALVRTHLIIARKLTAEQETHPLKSREPLAPARWVHVSTEAASHASLVGSAFPGRSPEAQFASWLSDKEKNEARGIKVQPFDFANEWLALRAKSLRRSWFEELEGHLESLPLFSASANSFDGGAIPQIARDFLPASFDATQLVKPEDLGICIGQGLRTGCNRFFYVDACEAPDRAEVRVRASALFNHVEFAMPKSALRPVLRRQSELACLKDGALPTGRVLDLRNWVLPEDYREVTAAKPAYEASGENPPQPMPDELAAFVREAAKIPLDGDGTKLIPRLSAVCTNVRSFAGATPRFWYMLPEFAPRHLPAAFIPRVIHGAVHAECNLDPPILIDANFSTIWADDGWTPAALKALFASSWCRLMMEAIGTPLGGGALKLEAAHLRSVPLPPCSPKAARRGGA
jgi:hypothetical protein